MYSLFRTKPGAVNRLYHNRIIFRTMQNNEGRILKSETNLISLEHIPHKSIKYAY